MKCLLCSASFDNDEKLIEHYVEYHKVDRNNRFFQKLFQLTKKGSIFRKCLRYGAFLSAENFKVKHDFLKHYADGDSVLFEDKPIEIVKTRNITKYEVSVNKHTDYYDFGNAQQVVDDFLRNVRSKFRPRSDVLLKRGFLIENIHPFLHENSISILNTRCWSTEPYQTKYFYDYIFYSLRENILKRVIVNEMSGSSWGFRRFVYLNLKTIDLETKILK